MNELIFTLQIVVLSLFLLLACRRYFLLSALGAISLFLANFTAIKQAPIFGLSSIGTESYISTVVIALFILQEQYDKKTALETLFSCITLLCVSSALLQLHLAYAPSVFDANSMAYYEVFHNSPQIYVGSMIALPIAMLVGIKLFEYLSLHYSQMPFWCRLGISYLPTQIIDTALFILTGLLGLTHAPLFNTILATFTLKLCVFIAFIPALIIIKKLISNPELDGSSAS